MFGYVLADRSTLTPEQLERYRGFYCGLCHELHTRHGNLSRLTLNYDMTFLIMLLHAMYEMPDMPDILESSELDPPLESYTGEQQQTRRCLPHPLRPHRIYRSLRYTPYAADMNVALAYFNCLDDWEDDHRILRLAQGKLLERSWKQVEGNYPRQCAAITTALQTLHQLERDNSPDIDACAQSFGALMGELFVVEEDRWADIFRSLGNYLGQFIYLMDACLDLPEDIRKHHYNPFVSSGLAELMQTPVSSPSPDNNPDKNQLLLSQGPVLKMLIGQCSVEFEKLPIVQDMEILRSILYSGVWTQFRQRLNNNNNNNNIN